MAQQHDDQPPGETTILGGLLARLRAGDGSARQELLVQFERRLRELAAHRLRRDPAVHRWVETDDIVQEALLRLNRALAAVSPDSVDGLIGLARTQIRRELIDLQRKFFQREKHAFGKHHESDPGLIDPGRDFRPMHEAQDHRRIDPSEQVALDEAVGTLPADLRDAFELHVICGFSQTEVAEQLGISERTVKRRFRDARLHLQQVVRPDGGDE